jgi:hypothetical protein
MQVLAQPRANSALLVLQVGTTADCLSVCICALSAPVAVWGATYWAIIGYSPQDAARPEAADRTEAIYQT